MDHTPIVWIFIGLELAIGALLAFVLWRIASLRRAVAESLRWPTARGRVVEGTIRQSYIYMPKGGRAVLYHAILVYEYSVAGRAYRSDSFNVDGPLVFSSHPQADAHLKKWPLGSELVVYYDPARPERAALSRRARRLGTLWFLVGVIAVMAFGVFSLFAFTPGMIGPGRWIQL
jgi:hypothetical protein